MGDLRDRIANLVEAFLFLLLTLLLYFFFILTVPIFRDPHGLLVMNDLSILTRSGLIKTLLCLSAGVCVLLGTFLMNWSPLLTARVMANLWATTFFFIWVDSVFSLLQQPEPGPFLVSFAAGLIFIYLFFVLLGHFGFEGGRPRDVPAWKTQAVQYWLWGWMGFYFSLSGFLVFNSFNYSGFHMPLAVGALAVCFLNYLLSLYLQRSAGKDVQAYSRSGRWVFTLWLLALVAIWLGQRWLF